MTPAERDAVLEEAAQGIERFLEILSPEARFAFEIAAQAVRALKEQEQKKWIG